MVTHAPLPFIVGKNLWDLTGGRLDGSGFGLDMVLDGKIPFLPDHSFHDHSVS
jgi:hypothetical protein